MDILPGRPPPPLWVSLGCRETPTPWRACGSSEHFTKLIHSLLVAVPACVFAESSGGSSSRGVELAQQWPWQLSGRDEPPHGALVTAQSRGPCSQRSVMSSRWSAQSRWLLESFSFAGGLFALQLFHLVAPNIYTRSVWDEKVSQCFGMRYTVQLTIIYITPSSVVLEKQ